MVKENKKLTLLVLLVLVLVFIVGTISAVSQTISVDVVETRDLTITFVPVDNVTNADFENINNYKGVMKNEEQ